jgi:hypothetical protein
LGLGSGWRIYSTFYYEYNLVGCLISNTFKIIKPYFYYPTNPSPNGATYLA